MLLASSLFICPALSRPLFFASTVESHTYLRGPQHGASAEGELAKRRAAVLQLHSQGNERAALHHHLYECVGFMALAINACLHWVKSHQQAALRGLDLCFVLFCVICLCDALMMMMMTMWLSQWWVGVVISSVAAERVRMFPHGRLGLVLLLAVYGH